MIHDISICKQCQYTKIGDYSLRLRHCKKCDNYGEKILKVDVTVVQKPVSVMFDCPHCEEEVEIDYHELCCALGEPCDWSYSKIECPRCGKTIEIDDVGWD